MDGWRQRLHAPQEVSDLCQPGFSQALCTSCNVLRPSLTESSATSACALIIGPPSSGKSLLTRLLIQNLSEHLSKQQPQQQLVVVHLSGLLHSTPARAWHQLSHDLLSWYQSTPATTTAITDENDDENGAERMKTSVQPALEKLRQTGSALLLVLDEVHRFANADPLAQTVLYSLLNLLQDRSLKAGCIAQTPYVDVTDLLEKRVLSRLAHRKIVVPLVEDAEPVLDFLKAALLPPLSQASTPIKVTITPTSGRKKGRGRGRGVKHGGKGGTRVNSTAVNAAVQAVSEPPWKIAMRELLEDTRLKQAIIQHLMRTRVITPIIHAVDSALSLCLPPSPPSSPSQIENNNSNNSTNTFTEQLVFRALPIIEECLGVRDTTVDTIMSLTQVQLALLVSLRRVESCNVQKDDNNKPTRRILFTDVYREYCKLGRLDEGRLAETDVSQVVVERSVAARAWESLIDCGLVVRTGTGPRDGRSVHCAVTTTQIDVAVENHEASSSILKHWAKQRIVTK